jgi:hypothetical protein
MHADTKMTVEACMLQIADLEQSNNDLRCQVDQLIYDNQQLSSAYEKEQ